MAKKHKYSLEEVKEYYKNAHKVKCMANGYLYVLKDINKIYGDWNGYRYETPTSFIRLSNYEYTELAKIFSYKTPQEPNYEIY